jgi:FkbM family methyltransferase
MSDLIFDIGAHKGEDTALYLAKGFRVVAVEAHPGLAHEIESRFSGAIHAGQLTVVQAAISDQDGPVVFYENEKVSVWGTLSEVWARRNALMGAPSRCITVPSVKFEDLLEAHGTPYYLKVDIEGADLLCIQALRGRDKPRHLSVEATKSSWVELLAEFDLLDELGYTHYKVVPQHDVQKQRAPRPALEGEYVPYRPMLGSSGFFGDEAPGHWLDREAAINAYLPAYITYALYGDDGLVYRHPEIRAELERYVTCPASAVWFDTHATRKDLT